MSLYDRSELRSMVENRGGKSIFRGESSEEIDDRKGSNDRLGQQHIFKSFVRRGVLNKLIS